MSPTTTNDFVRVTSIPSRPEQHAGLRVGGIYRVTRWTRGCGDRFPRVALEGDDTAVLAWEEHTDGDPDPKWELVDLHTIKQVRITAVPSGWRGGKFTLGSVFAVDEWCNASDGVYPLVKDSDGESWLLANADGSDAERRPSWEPVPNEDLLPVGVVKPAPCPPPPGETWVDSVRAAFATTPEPPARALVLMGAVGCADLLRLVLNKAREGTKRDAVLTCWSIVSLLANALGEPIVIEKEKNND